MFMCMMYMLMFVYVSCLFLLYRMNHIAHLWSSLQHSISDKCLTTWRKNIHFF